MRSGRVLGVTMRPSKNPTLWAAASLVIVIALAFSTARVAFAVATPASAPVVVSPVVQTLSNSSAGPDLTQFVSLQVKVNSTSKSGVSYDALDPSVGVSTAWSGSTLLVNVTTSPPSTGLQVIQVEIADSALGGASPSSIKVGVNGTAVPLASSIASLLNTETGSPSYMLSSAASVYSLLIAIPHPSRAALSVAFPATNAFLLDFVNLFLLAGVGIIAMAVIFLIRSRAKSRRLGKRITFQLV